MTKIDKSRFSSCTDMWLIDTETLQLKHFGDEQPPYAILSHTWGLDEVTFSDFHDHTKRESQVGFKKIKRTCELAQRDNLDYAWVDTCCINKDSSAELQEAINSMFKWYCNASVCYAYIEDLYSGFDWNTVELDSTLSDLSDKNLGVDDAPHLAKCRWFSRGWTLQELLAPREVVFYDAHWTVVGNKCAISDVLEKVTRIPKDILNGTAKLKSASVAARMSWASRRQTSRKEDIAYCLMGIFGVNMPLLYGEGQTAFIRLQEEILKGSRDDSLFAWRADAGTSPYRGLFASSPDEFVSSSDFIPFSGAEAGATSILGQGLVALSCMVFEREATGKRAVLGLRCSRKGDSTSNLGIEVVRTSANTYLRTRPCKLSFGARFEAIKSILIEKHTFKTKLQLNDPDDVYRRNAITISGLPTGLRHIATYPDQLAHPKHPEIVPHANAIGRKIAFEIDVAGEDYRLLLIVCVQREMGSEPCYRCFFSLEAATPTNTRRSFANATTPRDLGGQREVRLSSHIIRVAAEHREVEGYPMLCFDFAIENCFPSSAL